MSVVKHPMLQTLGFKIQNVNRSIGGVCLEDFMAMPVIFGWIIDSRAKLQTRLT